MSNIIRLLPEHIANQIAAGEVIQRPASVVKELMENAIDAGADKIQVIIKDAGRSLIQLIDNGKGMSEHDALLCFERHATSKVQSTEDLFALQTKGFRGEALASIAAIAHVTLKTRNEVSETGIKVIMEGSKLVSKEECVAPLGSSFEVKHLFFNVPARRNFLKSDNVEFNHIMDEFERVALAHPELNFSLKHNDQDVYLLQSGVLRKRIVDVLGKSSNDKLVPVDETTDIVKISGYIGKPEFAKRTRGEQFFFVNNRFFRDAYLNNAVNKAFDGMIQPKMFPTYFLFLQIDPKKIDVNVHPTKTEIKFEEERSIYSILMSSIRQALGKYNIAPTLDFDRETSFDLPLSMKGQPALEPIVSHNPEYNPFQSTKNTSSTQFTKTDHSPALRAAGFGNTQPTPEDWQRFYKIEDEEKESEIVNLDLEEENERLNGSVLLKGKYALTPCKSGIMMIHLERAIERIIYDQLINDFISKPISSQKLLFPFTHECSTVELRQWTNCMQLITRLGFESVVTETEIQIHAVPAIISENQLHNCLNMLLTNISFKEIDKGEIAHELIRSIACGASRNRTFHEEALLGLIEDLFASPEHVYSPSGKRILNTLSLEEIATKF